MTPFNFQNDDRFSIAPPWIVDYLVDVPFFSVSSSVSQSFHAVIVLKDGQNVGVPVYNRTWIMLTAGDLQRVNEVLRVISPSDESKEIQASFDDKTGGHPLQPEKEATMNDSDKDPTNETQALICEILGISAATCGGENGVMLSVRMNPTSFETNEVFFRLAQAQERLQTDLADLLERSPVFKDGG